MEILCISHATTDDMIWYRSPVYPMPVQLGFEIGLLCTVCHHRLHDLIWSSCVPHATTDDMIWYRALVYPRPVQILWFSSMVPTHQPLNPALTVHHPKTMKASNSFPLQSLIDFFISNLINYLLVTTFYSCLSPLLWAQCFISCPQNTPKHWQISIFSFTSLSDG